MAKKAQLWLAAAAVLLAICDANLTLNETKQFLHAHNDARAAVGVRPLRWNKTLASDATALAAHPPGAPSCELSEQAPPSKYGTTQAAVNLLESPAAVVGSWVDEGRRYYNYKRNLCAAGHKNECRSYTQVVWRKTAELGCGKSNCGKDGFRIVCLYDPRGNIFGDKPY